MLYPRAAAPRAPGLDILRTIAVLLVILYHYPSPPQAALFRWLFAYGWIGVDLFFVLSGFLIGGQLFGALARGESFSFQRFFLRRIARTLPNYLFCLFAFYVLWPDSPLGQATPLWRYLTLTQNFGALTAFIPSWSLCIEEHFYLALPLGVMAVMATRERARWPKSFFRLFAALIAAEVALRALLWVLCRPDQSPGNDFDQINARFFNWIEYPTLTHLDGIVFGLILACTRAFHPKLWARLLTRRLTLSVAAAGLFALSFAVNHPPRTFLSTTLEYTLLGATFSTAVITVSGPALARRLPRAAARLFSASAQLSFAIYLLTEPVLHFLQQDGWYNESVSPLTAMLATASTLVAASSALHLLVERPFLSLRDRLAPGIRKLGDPVSSWSPDPAKSRTALVPSDP